MKLLNACCNDIGFHNYSLNTGCPDPVRIEIIFLLLSVLCRNH